MNKKEKINNYIKRTSIYPAWCSVSDRWSVWRWERSGRPAPAPHARKRAVVTEFGRRYSLTTLIETGTHLGVMVFALRHTFDLIISIELSEELFSQAKERLKAYPHIQLLQGNSGKILPEILNSLDSPCLFWLDGHYSGGSTARGDCNTPVLAELTAILRHPVKSHFVLIDDARLFTGEDDYPTLETIKAKVAAHRPEWSISVQDDVVQIGRLLS